MNKRRVMIVEDSRVMRQFLIEIFAADPGFEVCGVAENGLRALDRFERFTPDLVTLDLELPGRGGIEVLRQLRNCNSRTPVLVVSSRTYRGAECTVNALAAGASDYLEKPGTQGGSTYTRESFASHLLIKARALVIRQPVAIYRKESLPETGARQVSAVVVGSSTGGPEALAKVLPHLAKLPVPVLIVQHMPAVFTRLLAERLSQLCDTPVYEAKDGTVVRGGDVVIAPGEQHLRIARENSRGLEVRVSGEDPVNFCRPSVDLLFESAAATVGSRTLAVVLTGMGSDGSLGAVRLKNEGACVIVQDEQSSVVWGMPGSAVRAGAADRILPIQEIGPAIARSVSWRQVLSPKRTEESSGASFFG